MNHKGFFIFAIILIFLISLSLSSAEIIISQPNSLYNIGDSFSVNVAVSKSVSTNDFFIATLVCDQNDIELYRSPLNVIAGETKNINVSAKLDKSLIRNSRGSCYLQVDFADQLSYTQNFKISSDINVNVNSKSSVVNPDEQLTIIGNAKKENGKDVDGFVEIYISSTNLSLIGNVKDGLFYLNITIPSNMPAGQYTINARVYEREFSDEITNEGKATAQVKVNQVLKGITIALSQEYIKPGTNVSYIVNAYDQSNLNFPTDINSIIYQPNSSEIFIRKLVISNQNNVISIPKNASPGQWNIEAFIKSFSTDRQFFVETNKEISIRLENNTLLIFNEGNVDYNDIPVEITVGDKVLPPISSETLNLTIGKQRRFLINAPVGTYDISWHSGSQNYSFYSVSIQDPSEYGLAPMTGNFISLKDLDNVSTTKINSIIWILVIVFLVLLSVYYYLKVRKRNFTGRTPSSSNFSRSKEQLVHSNHSNHNSEKVVSFIPPYQEEEHKHLHSHNQIRRVEPISSHQIRKVENISHSNFRPKPIAQDLHKKPITYQRLGTYDTGNNVPRPRTTSSNYHEEPITYKRLGTSSSDEYEFKQKPTFVQRPIKTYSDTVKPTAPLGKISQLNFDTYDPGKESSISGATKEEVVVVALKIKNAQKLRNSESSAFMTVEHALNKARALKAKVYDQGDSKIIVFSNRLSPKITAVEAVKTAIDVDKMLKEFNRKFAIKIDYGIGVNSGEMFFEIVEGKAKFTSVGSTLLLAKNIADKAQLEVLISQSLHRKVYSVIKGEITSNGLYRVNSFVDRNHNSEFIQRFMKGNETTRESTRFRQL